MCIRDRVFVFALTAGCGNNDANNAGTPAGDGQGTGEDDNQQAEGDTITIGVNFELSGDLASYGQSKINGVKIALEEINENGGILGKTVVLKEYDNKGDNAEAVNLATRLMGEDKVPVMMGPVTSGRVMAAISVAKQFQTPMVTGTGKMCIRDRACIGRRCWAAGRYWPSLCCGGWPFGPGHGGEGARAKAAMVRAGWNIRTRRAEGAERSATLDA